jgi:hypothetical protein
VRRAVSNCNKTVITARGLSINCVGTPVPVPSHLTSAYDSSRTNVCLLKFEFEPLEKAQHQSFVDRILAPRLMIITGRL